MWPDLDSLLVKLWESCSIRTKVVYNIPPNGVGGTNAGLGVSLLPESTERGVIDLFERPDCIFELFRLNHVLYTSM